MDQPVGQSLDTLKGRQLDCMLLVKEGYSSKQIARELGISPRTVDQHIASALETLGVSNRMAAISQMYKLDQSDKQTEDPGGVTLISGNNLTVGYNLQGAFRSRPTAILPPIGGSLNRGSRSDRIAWMVRIAIFCIMLTCAGILSVLGVAEVANYSNR